MIFDDRICELGEGPLWHPKRNQLFWFDILEKKLLTTGQEWQFDNYVSAAGWIDENHLMLAQTDALSVFEIQTGTCEDVCPLEADNTVTRPNDGRADPWGGFWISTMGFNLEHQAGAIYRYYRGELRKLHSAITVPNAICFTPDHRFVYFTDTPTQKIMRQPLDTMDGWPTGDAKIWLDLSTTDWHPDGAVVDAVGNFWNAQWGGHRVACYAPDGSFLRAIPFSAAQTTCPAFGGDNLSDLYCTSAAHGLTKGPAGDDGKTFVVDDVATGQAEHQVVL